MTNRVCRDCRETLQEIADGGNPPEAVEARSHARECAACREWERSLRLSLSLLDASLPDETVDLADRVMAAVPAVHPYAEQHQAAHVREKAWRLGLLLWFSGVALVAVAVALFVRMGGVQAVALWTAGLAATGSEAFASALRFFIQFGSVASAVWGALGAAAQGLCVLAIVAAAVDMCVVVVVAVALARRLRPHAVCLI